MDLTIPTIPAGVLTLLAFLGPFAVAVVNGALRVVTEPWQKRAVAVVVAVILAAAVIVIYVAITGDMPPTWPLWVLWSIVILSASYALVTKTPAARLEATLEATRST